MKSCNNCSAICCIAPPQLSGEDEILKALVYGVDVVAIKNKDSEDEYVAFVKKKNYVCPFLEDGKCRIYSDRFEACRNFECIALSFEDVNKVQPTNLPFFTTNRKSEVKPNAVSREFLRMHDIRVIDEYEAMSLITVSNDVLSRFYQK